MKGDGAEAEYILCTKALVSNVLLFKEYHEKYPSHGYRWLNAKIKLDTGLVVSDVYAHKCCKIAGIKSKSKHYHYKKARNPFKVYPNLLLADLYYGSYAMYRERYDGFLCQRNILRIDALHGFVE